ncbi:hypothetical protein ACS0TY_017425 [Phlomoides rotata]
MKGGKVGFTPTDSDADEPMATFVKSIQEMPYNISVIQISHTLSSPSAEAPTAAPADINLISLLARQGCKSFSGMLTAQGADDVFTESIKEGLIVFCPSDDVVKSFAPSYKNLTAAGKTSLLLYHGVGVYESMDMLRSGAGSRNTLATEGAKKFDFTVKNDGDDVKIVTKLNSATITGTLIDKDPVAVYQMDEWRKWLVSWEEGGDGDAELFVQTLNVIGGSHESSLSHPKYQRLLEVTTRICHQLQKLKVKEIQGCGTVEVESDMQELVKLVLTKSSGDLDCHTKQNFLTIARSFYYTAHCSTDIIGFHIDKVLFERLV